jgi:AcrR family transcriptional regulator
MRRAPSVDLGEVLSGALRAAPGGETPSDPILDAAAELLAVHGLAGWTVEDVARRAGVGRATVYRRYASRDDLVRETLARQARAFFAAVAAAVSHLPDPNDQLAAGFVVGIKLARGSLLASLVEHDPPAALSLLGSRSMLSAGRGALVDAYRSLVGRDLRAEEESAAAAGAELLLRLGLSYVLAPEPPFDDRMAAAVARLLGGVPQLR